MNNKLPSSKTEIVVTIGDLEDLVATTDTDRRAALVRRIRERAGA